MRIRWLYLCRSIAVLDFSLTALRNQVGLSELTIDRDAGALKYPADLRNEPGF